MQVSEQGLALIRQYEGFSATPYVCPAGRLTIGYGHVIRDKEQFAGGISQAQADLLLKSDIAYAGQMVNKYVRVTLNQHQFDALVSFTYNAGTEAFVKSTLLRLLNAGDTAGAAAQLSRWVYAGNQRLDGLVARRAAETALFCQKTD